MEKSIEEQVKEHLCAVYGFAPEDVQELYAIGCQTLQDTWSRVEVAFAGEDMASLVEASHMFKGTLLNMGLSRLGEMAKALEFASKKRDWDEVVAIHGALKNALQGFVSRP